MFRPVVMGKNGLVTSSHPLASQVGIDVLKAGGNAFDAIIAVNAVLSVVSPQECGIGGDAFYLLYSADLGRVLVLNGSGRSPVDASIDIIRERGYDHIPQRGVLSLTVPGCVHAWGELQKRFGSLELEQLLRPAVTYARDGFPLSHNTVNCLQKIREVICQEPYLQKTFMPGGKVVQPGEIIRQKPLADSLEQIGHEGVASFYRGEIADTIHKYVARKNGLLSRRDLNLHVSTWEEPLGITYRGYRIMQTPPNTQGLAALLALNIIEGLDIPQMGCDSPELIHFLVETKKIAYQYRDQYITDPEFVPLEYEEIMDKQLASRLYKMINPARARFVDAWGEFQGTSAFFAVADRHGNIAAGAQSLHSPFGSGCAVEETGIILQNRGAGFSMDPTHINRLEPYKRTIHTLTACLVEKDKTPVFVLGASGAECQPQVYLQVLVKLLHFGYNIQEAIEAPRWVHGAVYAGDSTAHLNMEGRFPVEIVGLLESWGHNTRLIDEWAAETGQAQGIAIDPVTGVYSGGADPRTDGYVIAW